MRLGVNDWQLKSGPQSQQIHPQFATLQRHSSAGQTSQQSVQLFATLTRGQHQLTAAQAQQLALQQQQHSRHNYTDYTRLTVQNRLMRQMNTSPQTIGASGVQPVAQMAGFARKPVIDWSCDEVQEWLKSIGMSEHLAKFEFFKGAKLMRFDNNALLGSVVRQQQHRIYLLEKLKQQILKNHH